MGAECLPCMRLVLIHDFVQAGSSEYVQALARACTPDMRSMRPAAAADMQGQLLEAVDETIQELSFWLDAGDLMDLGCSAGDDAAVMRLACATGLLRLCRLHSDRLSPERYMLLALSMQVQGLLSG